jgi:serine/threonine protein kinase
VLAHLAATDPEAPAELGRYRLEKEIGSGGMGVVWRAWDPLFERAVAIKRVRPELGDDLGKARALREARALARLQHPNVIAAYDVGIAGEDVYLATELIEGETLDRWQRDQPPEKIVAAYVQAARGLAAAHALGLVHRDVKPSNIFVARDGTVKIGDFGLAIGAAPLGQPAAGAATAPPPSTSPRAPSSGPPSSAPPRSPSSTAPLGLPKLTHEGHIPGTPAYMAPEQKSAGAIDGRADQFSLSLALAEALLGKAPRPGTNAAALANAERAARTRREGAAGRAARNAAQEQLARVAREGGTGRPAPWPAIARGLATRPEDRFPDLLAWIAAVEAPARVPLGQVLWARWRPLLLGAAAALGLGAALVLVRGAGQPEPSAPAPPPAPAAAPLPSAAPLLSAAAPARALPVGVAVEIGAGARLVVPPGFRYVPATAAPAASQAAPPPAPRPAEQVAMAGGDPLPRVAPPPLGPHRFARSDGATLTVELIARGAASPSPPPLELGAWLAAAARGRGLDLQAPRPPRPPRPTADRLVAALPGAPGAPRFLVAAAGVHLFALATLEVPGAAPAAAEALADELAAARLLLERPAGKPISLDGGGTFLLPDQYGYAREAEGLAIWGPRGGEFLAIQTYEGFSAATLAELLDEFGTTQQRVLDSYELIGPGQLRARFHAENEALVETLYTSSGEDHVYVLLHMVDPAKLGDPDVERIAGELTARVIHAEDATPTTPTPPSPTSPDAPTRR